ncbi:dihydrodipicolinate synthase family protein [Phototrophicus methaneseepsis]|uniref:Dihydrodipicolinate synthase family protein n=1 Tax=Phototrophicus methaneseepsis TaxID=2710758 RepID=A0A7S8EAF9_9CHLR|nr:dihydrodipicolinate synthase family protein [Phototrophicus methaneseepsis]QPC83321.1 dihydrodipicolinate synthase family protein [Phototrophicus methaneseepsis]
MMKLKGVIPPMLTPLSNGEVDAEATKRLIHHLIESGVAGIFVMGSTGEGPWLNQHQRKALLAATVDAVDGRVPILAGALEPGTGPTLEAIQLIAGYAVDVVVVATPYYFQADAATQAEHARIIADESPLPVMLYNIPQMTHNPLRAETVAQLLDHENIIGIKDSQGDWANFEALLKLKEQRADFIISQGAEAQGAQSALAGADVLVPGISNLIPEKFVSVMNQASLGHTDEVHAMADEISGVMKGIYGDGFWLPRMKYAASLRGFGDGSRLAPAPPLAEAEKEAVRSYVERYLDKT